MIEVAHECLIDSVGVIVELVRELVGELDFSFDGLGTAGTSSSSVAEKDKPA